MSEEIKSENRSLANIEMNERGIRLSNMDDMYRFARAIVASGFAPKDVKTPETALVAMQMGMELGLSPMKSIQCIAVINGRPSIWGDVLPGIAFGTGEVCYHKQYYDGKEYNDDFAAVYEIQRRGYEKVVSRFSVADAKKAALWSKTGPWQQYPKRMLLNRARAFAIRDTFPDCMSGIYTKEEVLDMPPVLTDAEVLETETHTPRTLDEVVAHEGTPEHVDPETGEIAEREPGDEPQDSLV